MNANMVRTGPAIELPSVIENINIAFAIRLEDSFEHIVLNMSRTQLGPILQAECENRDVPLL